MHGKDLTVDCEARLSADSSSLVSPLDPQEFREQLKSLTTDQLLVVDRLIQARASAINDLCSLATRMERVYSQRDAEDFAALKLAAKASREQYAAVTIAIKAALSAFRPPPGEITHL